MPKFKIYWDAGYGRTTDEVEAENEDEAIEKAADLCQEEAQSNWDYGIDKDDE